MSITGTPSTESRGVGQETTVLPPGGRPESDVSAFADVSPIHNQDNKIPASGRRAAYLAWWNMLDRCYSPDCASFKHYGGRGIEVCARWRVSFDAFLADVGPRPAKGLTLDRINNDGNYEPGNVRWADWLTQGRNRAKKHRNESRGSVRLTLNGETRSIAAWSRRLGINRSSLQTRLRNGWELELALSLGADVRRLRQERRTEPYQPLAELMARFRVHPKHYSHAEARR